ncbi:MAG: SIS domain-containing protein [Sedimentisphaerales bacterium]|nr:SIS domain-containing protein [Sedimentisphaerales bacterium]
MQSDHHNSNAASSYSSSTEMILSECRHALSMIEPHTVEELIDTLLSAEQVFFIGVGRVMLALQSMAKRLAHLGLKTHCVGDITEPAITECDVLIVGSGSGESLVPVAIARKAHKLGASVIHIGSNPESSLKPITSLMVRIPVQTKLGLPDEIASAQPMTSLFEQCLWLFGDTVAAEIVRVKKLDVHSLWHYHANLE